MLMPSASCFRFRGTLKLPLLLVPRLYANTAATAIADHRLRPAKAMAEPPPAMTGPDRGRRMPDGDRGPAKNN
jgi:hypothetical protein